MIMPFADDDHVDELYCHRHLTAFSDHCDGCRAEAREYQRRLQADYLLDTLADIARTVV